MKRWSASFVERDSQEVSVGLFSFTRDKCRVYVTVLFLRFEMTHVLAKSRLCTTKEVIVSGSVHDKHPSLYGYKFVAVRVLLTPHDFLGCSEFHFL